MKVGIYSLGCKVNIYESEYITELLKNHNYEIVDFNSKADIYIINTCSVTNASDAKSRKIIREAKKLNPNSLVIAMGCYTQIKPEDTAADIVIGNKDKSKIIELIKEHYKSNKKIEKIYDIRNNIEFEDMTIHNFENHTRAFVKIQDGCNAFCTYCIIPYARGRLRSKNFNTVIEEVTKLVNNGYKEIVLTGIHTGKYGIDIGTTLEKLLTELIKIPNIYRIRLSSIEINEITDGILNLMQNTDIIARHLHIPLQSGSDKILKLMNRKYNLDYFINRINDIKNKIGDISITTDLIVGFPNETEEDFQDTINTLNKIKFTKIHTFPYSKRDGTVASTMKNQIDGNIKKKRVKKVLELSKNMEYQFYYSRIGREYDILTETTKNNKCLGHTSNYIPITIEKNIKDNSIIKVKITAVDSNNIVYGKIVDQFK